MSEHDITLDRDDVKIEVIRLINDGHSRREAAEVLGLSKSAVVRFMRGDSYREWWEQNEKKPFASGSFHDHHTNIKKLDHKRYLFMSAQNNTFCHKEGLASVENCAERLGAEIIVGTFTYNKNGFQKLDDDEIWFDPKIRNYIVDEPVEVAPGLMWLGELNINPTAVNPLSGLQSYAKNKNAIIPHAKVCLESMPTDKGEQARMMYTTGAITKRNYIQKKTGQKASTHHVFGALLVEVDDDGQWFARQVVIESDTGNFYDLDTYYTPEGYTTGHSIEAIQYGDIHVEKADHLRNRLLYGNREDSLLNWLKPKYQFIHDVLDFESRNHHSINDPYHRFRMYVEGKDKVEENVEQVGDFLTDIRRDFANTVVVPSNHNEALNRWLKEADYKVDPPNAVFFLECQLAMYKSIERGDERFSILEYALKKVLGYDIGDETVFLHRDDGFKICDQGGNGIQCSNHGDMGVNGAKASITSFQKMGIRMNVGHSHTCGIRGGVYQAGISFIEEEAKYARGPGSWSPSHILTYRNGKRAIVTQAPDGRVRALN